MVFMLWEWSHVSQCIWSVLFLKVGTSICQDIIIIMIIILQCINGNYLKVYMLKNSYIIRFYYLVN